jgi:hypothetical protein
MKPKVLSILPRERFENVEVSFPAELEFSFKYVTAEDDIIEAFRRMLSQAIANIAAVAVGHPPKHVVNGVLKPRAPNC